MPTPECTLTHRPIPHHEIVNALVETLGFRHIAVHKDEYAVSHDGAKMFGIMELETTFGGCRFALGLRNSHDRSLALGITVGYRVMVCSNLAFSGDYTPVLRRHTKNFDLHSVLSIGVDNVQRNFEPMVQAVDRGGHQLTDVEAKLIIYEEFRGRRPPSPSSPGARSPQPVLQSSPRGIPTSVPLLPPKCFHGCVQRAGSHPASTRQ